MRLDSYTVPQDLLDRLARGGGGAEAAQFLAETQYSKHLLLLRGVAEEGRAEAAYDRLAEIAAQAPEAVRYVIGYPAVGAWAKSTLRALITGRADPLAVAQLGAVAAAAACRAGLRLRVQVPAPGGVITLPSLGQLVLPTDEDQLIELETGTSRCTPLHRIRSADGAIELVVDDLDPHRWPGPTVIDGRLPPDDLRRWRRHVAAAWELLDKHHWTTAAELRAIARVLTPIKAAQSGRDSATSRVTFGTVAMSTPPDHTWLASTFAHELQHAKLNAVLDLVELTLPDERRYYAPWRGDPRPLSGLLHGAYAHLGLAGFWRRQRDSERGLRPHIEFARWRAAALEVTGTLLDSGKLTPVGERFTGLLRRTLSSWMKDPVPPAAAEAAAREADEHRAAWLARNGVTGTADRSPSRSARP
ncbi:HEXXH motif domain-containing protein [Nonomuraea sp. NPDC003560]|uniref:HEXXH motif domain-containing protein n=1 Tax=Nonomuraea sp. NPDC003560 TaxID=3364341 RepID=UPI003688DF47